MTTPTQANNTARLSQVAFVIVLAVAGLGYVVGMDYGAPQPTTGMQIGASDLEQQTVKHDTMPATSYSDLRALRIGANRDFRSSVSDLAAKSTPLDSPASDRSKRQSLASRATRRAFDGAPPVIPHVVEQLSSDGCPACHESAVTVGDQHASAMPHPFYSECQQCHVAASPLFDSNVLAGSNFRGKRAPFKGARAWSAAPPTIPHSTWLRDQCSSCHGVHGKPGIQTSHPERVNCVQCHAPSAVLDQVPFADE